MTEKNQNFIMRAGDKVLIRITVEDHDREDGTIAPFNLHGHTIEWALWDKDKVLVQKSSDNEGEVEVVDAEKGIFQIVLTSEDTENLPDGHYYHEARVHSSPSEKYTVTAGLINIKKRIDY